MDRPRTVFGNGIPAASLRAAERSAEKYRREFGDDSESQYVLGLTEAPALAALGVKVLTVEPSSTAASPAALQAGLSFDLASDPTALVVGTIRMGYGHYRIATVLASAARAAGRTPYWFDLHAFRETTAGKIVAKLNGLYSLGSRLSQKHPLFNALYWEPLNSEGFRRLSYYAVDRRVAELMAPPCRLLPRDIPFVASHAWPAQAALAAGMTRVVNAIPDNWPMALHLAEGAIHCVQTPSAWFGYKTLRGMSGRDILAPMDEGQLHHVGHYVDHELVSNIGPDTEARIRRLAKGDALRVLLSIGGAGAQRELFTAILKRLAPLVRSLRLVLFVNAGDHADLLSDLRREVPDLAAATTHENDWAETASFAREALGGKVSGIHLFHNRDAFAAVYATNLLMRASDLLVTKPSELAFYPVPKLLVKRVGGHEAWGAIRSAEIGDGTVECSSTEEALSMLGLLLNGKEALRLMNDNIRAAAAAGVYSGAYRAVDLALGRKAK